MGSTTLIWDGRYSICGTVLRCLLGGQVGFSWEMGEGDIRLCLGIRHGAVSARFVPWLARLTDAYDRFDFGHTLV